jgi:hypothetical protein
MATNLPGYALDDNWGRYERDSAAGDFPFVVEYVTLIKTSKLEIGVLLQSPISNS